MNNSYFNIFTSVSEASLILKAILSILLILSIYSWGVIINKIRIISKLASLTKKLRLTLQKGSNHFNGINDIENVFSKYKKNPYLNVLAFLSSNKDKFSKQNNINPMYIEKIYNILYDTNFVLEKRLSSLATIGTISPFIGLFGTVVGIINSFSSIGSNSSASLAIIAPGIAEALYATAFGLFVAVPAVFAYNILINRLESYKVEQDVLLQEIVFYSLQSDFSTSEHSFEVNTNNDLTTELHKSNSLSMLQQEQKAQIVNRKQR